MPLPARFHFALRTQVPTLAAGRASDFRRG